jgi:hypothetical protein
MVPCLFHEPGNGTAAEYNAPGTPCDGSAAHYALPARGTKKLGVR